MSLSRKKCCVPGCLDSGNSSKTLHLFPNPEKDKERFNQWVYSIGGEIIGLDDQDIYQHRSVCHAHFEEKFCCRFNRLCNIAVPTLNMPGLSASLSLTFSERRPFRQIQSYATTSQFTSVSASVLPTSASLDKPSTSSTGLLSTLAFSERRPFKQIQSYATTSQLTSASASVLPTSASLDKPSTSSTDPDIVPQPASLQGAKEIKTAYVKKKSIKTSKMYVTPEERKLRQKLIKLQFKISKCRNRIKKQSASLKAARNIASNPTLLAALEKMPRASKILTMMQFKEAGKKSKGRRFNLQEKILALSLMKQAPKGYRFLRKVFILPAPQTLAKLISQADIKPGMNKKIFGQLKSVAQKLKLEDRLCVLIFDEMYLKAHISYNEKKDKVIGFVTNGQVTQPDYADHAQVFMVRGLVRNYKQPISYSFSAAATSGQEISRQIKENVTALQEAGFVVVATVCDQGANNRQAIKLLLQETRGVYLRNEQEPKDNIILINDKEVIPLYDPPHLLKCIRNNLLTKNLEYTSNGSQRTAKWDHLVLLHKENPGYSGMRLIPKLTESHVIPEKVSKNKMKVKFASQIFSRTVATNMGYLADKGILPNECKETADILLFFDNLFDSLNGSYMKKEQKFAKPLLGPATPKSIHHKEWAEAKLKLKSMKFVHPISGKIENVPTLKNWAWTLDGIEVLLKKIQNEFKITSIWMRHLNQDPIENFFGCIRSHGCRNTNPTPENFEGTFVTLLINNMSSVHAPVGNCEKDFCENLHSFIVSDNCSTPAPCDLQYLPTITIESIENKKDPRILGPLQYVSGYFARMAKKKIFKTCQNCATDFIAAESTEYIKYREYAGRQWLCSPTDSLINCISAIQDITYAIIKQCFQTNNLKELIKTHLIMFVNFDYIHCEEHKNKIMDYLINLTSRFFIFNYCKDLNRILTGKWDCQDNEDLFKIRAKRYYKKCSKRPINK